VLRPARRSGSNRVCVAATFRADPIRGCTAGPGIVRKLDVVRR
jgi:hypothetical protein